ncbi:hypothetical protein VPH35_020748 [Triticum aestivum]
MSTATTPPRKSRRTRALYPPKHAQTPPEQRAPPLICALLSTPPICPLRLPSSSMCSFLSPPPQSSPAPHPASSTSISWRWRMCSIWREFSAMFVQKKYSNTIAMDGPSGFHKFFGAIERKPPPD